MPSNCYVGVRTLLLSLAAFGTLAAVSAHSAQAAEGRGRGGFRQAGGFQIPGDRPSPDFRMHAREIQDYLHDGDFDKSESLAQELLARYRDSANAQESSVAHLLLARTYIEEGRYGEAEPLVRQAVAIREKRYGELHGATVKALFQLSRALQPQGKYAETVAVLQRALDLQRQLTHAGHPDELFIVIHLANAQLNLGRAGEAERLLRQALDASRETPDTKSRKARAGTLFVLARVLQRRGRPGEAEKAAREALALREEIFGKSHVRVAQTLNVLGRTLVDQKRDTEAEPHLKRALGILEKSRAGTSPEAAKAHMFLAIAALHRNNGQAAAPHLKRAVEIARTANSPALVANFARAYGRFLVKQGRPLEALPYYREAVDAVEQMFANTRGLEEEVREGFTAQYAHIYQETIELLLRLHETRPGAGHDREALAVVSRTQSRLFSEMLRQADVNQFSAEPHFAELRAEREKWQARVAALGSARQPDGEQDAADTEGAEGPDDAGAAATRSAALAPRLAEATQALKGAEDRLWKEFPRYMELVQPRPVTVEAVQQRLRPDEALITYALLREKTAIFVVTPTGFRLAMVPLGHDAVAARIAAARQPMERMATSSTLAVLTKLDPATLNELYRTLLAPAEPALQNTRQIVVVGDGAVYTLPLEMLVTRYGDAERRAFEAARASGGASLGEYATLPYAGTQWRFSYLPSLAALVAQRDHPKQAVPYRLDLVSFADPVFQNERGDGAYGETTRSMLTGLTRAMGSQVYLPRLPETADEAKDIAATLGGKSEIFLRDQAQEKTVKTMDLRGVRYLHFATHGLLGGEFLLLKESKLAAEIGADDNRTRTLAVVAANGQKPATDQQPADDDAAPEPTPGKRGQPALALTLVGDLKGEDGLLTLKEVVERLNLNADLVVLSACNTAGEGAEARNGEGFAGLTRGFMYAGAKGLVVSHWSVESQATKDLMVETFRAIKAGQPADTALAQARETIRKSVDTSNGQRLSRAHPYFWAPFVYVGD